MLIEWLKRPFKSLFTKLIIVMVLSGSVLVSGVFYISFHGFRENAATIFRNNLAQYASYIVKDLQENLNVDHARELSNRLFMIIRYEGKNISWETSSGIPPLDKISFRKGKNFKYKSLTFVTQAHRPEINTVHFGRYHGQGVVIVETSGERFIFAETKKWRGAHFDVSWVITGLMFITITLILTWLALGWILKPVKWLSEGVSALGEGKLDHKVPEERSDELGKLARAFNRMAERLREMLKAREQLLLDVSHELRSPLTRMKVAFEFVPDDASKESLLDDVQEMEQMITEILETARLKSEHGQLNLETVNLVKLVQETCIGFEGIAPGINIKKLPSKCFATIDSEQIQTVLKNLLANALKYSPAANAPVMLSMETDQSGIRIEVKDHGQGIPNEEQDLIFEPFYRVDKSRTKSTGGYGLGLSLCKTIMETHSGSIIVNSTLGEGATFSVILPNSSSTH